MSRWRRRSLTGTSTVSPTVSWLLVFVSLFAHLYHFLGVFFLLGAGQLYLMRSQPALAVDFYTKAIECQTQYRNLHHISTWEIAVCQLALFDLPASRDCWKIMYEEATVSFRSFDFPHEIFSSNCFLFSKWSKAIYAYSNAVCLWETGDEQQKEEAAELFVKVPGLRQRIAGKSIPMEVSPLLINHGNHTNEPCGTEIRCS
jgi:hypothetical protein